MSDNYRDGCPGKRFGLGWWLVYGFLALSWLANLGERKGNRR